MNRDCSRVIMVSGSTGSTENMESGGSQIPSVCSGDIDGKLIFLKVTITYRYRIHRKHGKWRISDTSGAAGTHVLDFW